METRQFEETYCKNVSKLSRGAVSQNCKTDGSHDANWLRGEKMSRSPQEILLLISANAVVVKEEKPAKI